MTSLFQGSIALPGFPSEETSQKSRWGLVKKKKHAIVSQTISVAVRR